MQPAKQFKKDPDAVLDYGFDWGADGNGWLNEGDTIATSTWSLTHEDDDGELVVDSDSKDDETTAAVVSGGTLGRTYWLTNHIVTAAGLEDDRTIEITIQER